MTGGITLAPLKTRIEVDLKTFKSNMQQASTEGVKAAQDMSNKMKKAANVGATLEKAGSTMTKAFTVPLVGAGVACSKFYLDAENSFAKVNTIMDQTKVSNEELHKQVKEASNESGVAIGDFNEALYSSISAGIDSGKAIQFTTDMAKLAKGGFTSTEQAVNVVTTALNAYGMGADQATAVSDKLITTQNLGKTTVDELASSLGKVIPTANSYGVNIDNVCASLADLTKNGIATAEATTYYNSMLNELGKSGTKVSDVIKEKMGASFTDLMNQGVPLTDVLKVVKDSAEENGLALGDMFGSAEAAKAALTIMKDDGVEYNNILNDMQNSAGATDKAFQTMDQTPLEQLKKALNELKNAAIDFGGKMAPAIKAVTDILQTLADKFSSLTPEQQEFIIKAALIVATLGPVLSIVGKGITIFTSLSKTISKIKKAITGVQGAMTLLSGPVGIVIAIIGVLIGIGVLLYKNWDTIKEKAAELGNWISEKWEGLKKATTEKFNAVKDTITGAIETAKNNTKQRLDAMKKSYEEHGGGIKGVVGAMMDDVKDRFSKGYDVVNKLTGGKLDEVVNKFKDKFNKAKDTVKDAIEKIKGFFKFDWKLPDLKMPHITATGKFSLSPLQTPSFGIKWYKDGGIMTQPTLFGQLGSTLLGGGEAGHEAILPLDGFYDRLDRLFEEKMPKSLGALNVNIERFENNRSQDVKAFAEELEFYRQQLIKGGGKRG
ncbi:phage tail tape measure protein [Lachnospiraceae bacterium ASD3451]|uniref:phage tail tape measure protein n=1 Tax=Diplocloster agilis TaxID=2850323 RepID=UPI001DCB5AF7|nr:phage tail tape measure protein [Diplocloster agilis]MBU9746588.1 phage tail tape measure protein [Diplocloster agilis]